MNYGNCNLCGKQFGKENKITYNGNIIRLRYCNECVEKEDKNSDLIKTNQLLLELFNKSNIPELKRSIDIDNLTKYPELHDEVINQLKFWIFNNKKYYNGPFFYGNPGTGKTTLSYALANYFIKKEQKTVLYINIPNLFEQKKLNNNIDSIVKASKSSEITILDDLIYTTENIYNVQLLYSIIDDRLRKNKTTIITSQTGPSEILKLNEGNDTSLKYAVKALIDRCIELCNPIAIGDKNTISIRLLKAKERIDNFKKNYESTKLNKQTDNNKKIIKL